MESLVFETPQDSELFETVMNLPEKYRIVIHLYYFEDYSVHEIATVMLPSTMATAAHAAIVFFIRYALFFFSISRSLFSELTGLGGNGTSLKP